MKISNCFATPGPFASCRKYRMTLPLTACAAALLVGGTLAGAQSVPQATSSTSPPAAQDQYTGVSHPPSDDVIVANDDAQQPPAKPSPYLTQPVAPAQGSRVSAVSSPTAASGQVSADDPDGIVTTPVPDAAETAAQPPAQTDLPVHLVSRPVDPGDEIVDFVPTPANELAEGTNITVRLLQPLNTFSTEDGQVFRAQVAADVYKDGRVVIPVGAELRGHVTQVSQGHRIGTHAALHLRPDAVILPDGTAYHLTAEAIESSAPGTRTNDEGSIEATRHIEKDLAEYGGGAGGGAVLGAALGGPVGAGAGAVVGAGMVTTHMLLQKPAQASLETGSQIVFSLTEPMDLLATKN